MILHILLHELHKLTRIIKKVKNNLNIHLLCYLKYHIYPHPKEVNGDGARTCFAHLSYLTLSHPECICTYFF